MRKMGWASVIFSLCFGLAAGAGDLVKNPAKPLKGDWDFNLHKVWEVDSAGEYVLIKVGTIQVDEDGKIYALERKHLKMFVFDSQGNFLYSFGQRGEGPGEIKAAFNFYLLGDYIIIPDMGKIHYFTKKGEYIKSEFAGSMVFPRIFVDEKRFIYVKETGEAARSSDRLEIFDLETKQGQLIAEISPEAMLTASSGGARIVLKFAGLTPGVVLDAKARSIYFGKSDKYLIKKTSLEGKELLSFTLEGRQRKKISTAFKRKSFDNVLLNGGRMPKEMVDQMIKGMPDEAPFFKRIMVDDQGLIYVFVSDLENETGQEIDIFSHEGKYLYHSEIKMPDNYVIESGLTFKNGHLYIFAEDEEGEGKLLKFKIDMPPANK